MAEAAALEAAAARAGYRLTLLPGAAEHTPLVARARAAAPAPRAAKPIPGLTRAHPAHQVLCGWYGCQDKHLAKYSAVVNRLGCHTLRVQMPPATVFSLLCVAPLCAFAPLG